MVLTCIMVVYETPRLEEYEKSWACCVLQALGSSARVGCRHSQRSMPGEVSKTVKNTHRKRVFLRFIIHVSPCLLAGAKGLLDRIIRGHHVDGEAGALFLQSRLPSFWSCPVFTPVHLSTCSSMRPETYLSSYVLHVIPFLKTACLSMSHFFLLFACRPIHPSIPILPDPSFHPATDTHPPICSSICPSRPLMTPLYYNPLYLSHSTYIYLCLFTSI